MRRAEARQVAHYVGVPTRSGHEARQGGFNLASTLSHCCRHRHRHGRQHHHERQDQNDNGPGRTRTSQPYAREVLGPIGVIRDRAVRDRGEKLLSGQRSSDPARQIREETDRRRKRLDRRPRTRRGSGEQGSDPRIEWIVLIRTAGPHHDRNSRGNLPGLEHHIGIEGSEDDYSKILLEVSAIHVLVGGVDPHQRGHLTLGGVNGRDYKGQTDAVGWGGRDQIIEIAIRAARVQKNGGQIQQNEHRESDAHGPA